MAFIQPSHSYMETARVGFIRNNTGSLSIVPKPSAAVAYTAVTKYTAHWPGRERYGDNERWNLTGAQLVTGQDGYDCLFISNAMNGFYLLIGVWDRDPYTHNGLTVDYMTPRDPRRGAKRRPWSRALHSTHLKPVEICCASGTVIPRAFIGFYEDGSPSYSETKLHAEGVETAEVSVASLRPQPNQTLVSTFPKIDKANYTATYANTIRAEYVPPADDILQQVLSRDCPLPHNKLITDDELAEGYKSYWKGYVPKVRPVVLIYDPAMPELPPFAEQDIHSNLVLDTDLRYVNSDEWDEYRNRVRPTLWDRPMVLLNANRPAIGSNGDVKLQPAAVAPLMLYHEPEKDEQNNPIGPIDPKTGRRWIRGKTIITFITDKRMDSRYAGDARTRPTLYQMTRAITKNPIYDITDNKTNTLEKILNRGDNQ